MSNDFISRDFLTTLTILAGLCVLVFIVLLTTKKSTKEGMTDASGNTTNGIAGNAQAYVASIQAQSIKLQDTLLISKYRTEYEDAISAVNGLINNLMLQATLSVDTSNPKQSLVELNELNNARTALLHVVNYLDKS